jgi:hypothetical protein
MTSPSAEFSALDGAKFTHSKVRKLVPRRARRGGSAAKVRAVPVELKSSTQLAGVTGAPAHPTCAHFRPTKPTSVARHEDPQTRRLGHFRPDKPRIQNSDD